MGGVSSLLMGGMSSLSTGVFELSLDAGGSCGPADPPGLLRVLFAAVQGIVAVQGKQALSVPESYAL
ncbi:hypothetical protein M7I_6336 [Glarea lozoyensis 74030]|uniref:Uncharacterized protein n=1 Tax=Glarea lozoyensis (strain ATCC 74030 / MF5533) TaxID=1104152 RepID=H0EUA4_GLAL7|nr:hypothetical protein M7I_6336 [Glarea lozoyensis 74030]